MKALCILLVAMLLLPAVAPGQVTTVLDGSVLKLSLAKYDPFPAVGGKFVTVWIDIDNVGIQPANNVSFTLVPSYPFSLPDNDPERSFASIAPISKARMEYRLFVAKDAPNATSKIVARGSVGKLALKEQNFTITVTEGTLEKTADLQALFVASKPTPYAHGKSTVSLDIVNVGDATAYHTVVQAEAEIATIARNTVFIGNLESDDFDTIDLDLAFGNASEGQYPLRLALVYKDSNGNELVQERVIMLNLIPASAASVGQQENSIVTIVLLLLVAIIAARIALLPFARWLLKPLLKRKA